MSTQTEINEALVQYLQSVGYREDKIITELENETLKLGSVSQMQIAKAVSYTHLTLPTTEAV